MTSAATSIAPASLERIAREAIDRVELWRAISDAAGVRSMAEVGVYRGDFAAAMLTSSSIERYYLVDPWRRLPAWNKPANTDDTTFEQFHRETLEKTDFARDRRVVLRGTSLEIAEQIPDRSLDFVYIDADHTLRGITVDLIVWWDKVRLGGLIGGDDLSPTIWQHAAEFEPTLVFPYAVHFAEAKRSPFYALPHEQFLIARTETDHRFVDYVGTYRSIELGPQIRSMPSGSRVGRLFRRMRRWGRTRGGR